MHKAGGAANAHVILHLELERARPRPRHPMIKPHPCPRPGVEAMTASRIEEMGLWVVDLLSTSQLEAAAARFHATVAQDKQFFVPRALLRQTWTNHWHRCLRMPAGGAGAGGSMQTGFEMEMLTVASARDLMAGWPNFQELSGGGLAWEARTMEQAGSLLDFSSTKWGALNAKPITPLPQTGGRCRGLLMASPPVTVTWQRRADRSTYLTVRFPITVWTEENAMILPPDDNEGRPFYQDPSDKPGMHRDLFKAWALKVLGELYNLNYLFTTEALKHLPPEYESDSSEYEAESSSASSEAMVRPLDSSDEEGAHRPLDSSDEEGAHRQLDSSDEEGAHRPAPNGAARGRRVRRKRR